MRLIHCGLITAAGEAWAWGCGSNDGRCGVERFLNMSGDGRPPKVDEMKYYMMQPHRVGIARPEYWKYGKGLRDTNVVQLASSRNHMVAIGLVKEDLNKKAEKYRKENEELEAASNDLPLAMETNHQSWNVGVFKSHYERRVWFKFDWPKGAGEGV